MDTPNAYRDQTFHLLRTWHVPSGAYNERFLKGEVHPNDEFNGDFPPFNFDISEAIVGTDNDPTTLRAIPRIWVPGEEADVTVPLTMGYSESNAQTHGDFTGTLMTALLRHGYKNPQIIGIETLGRGMPRDLDKLGAITLQDDIDDAEAIMRHLIETGLITGDVILTGHSMGQLRNLGAMKAILENLDSTRGRLRHVVNLMGVTEGDHSLIRRRFLRHIVFLGETYSNLRKAYKREGYCVIPPYAHAPSMFGDAEYQGTQDFSDHYVRTVAESPLAYRDAILMRGSHRLADLVEQHHDRLTEVPFVTGESVDDPLLPTDRIVTQDALYEKLGLNCITPQPLPFAHALPVKFTDEQEKAMAGFWDSVLRFD